MRIRIEHDPDSGCLGCPFYTYEDDGYLVGCDCISPGSVESRRGNHGVELNSPAPRDCPLRDKDGSPVIIEVGAPGAWEREAIEENDE